jgi:hypothetical protein
VEVHPNQLPPQINFILASVKDVEWYIGDVTELLTAGYDLRQLIQLRIAGAHRVEVEQRLIVLRLTLAYDPIGEGIEPSVIMAYTSEMAFEIVNFSEAIVHQEGDNYTVPKPFLELLVSIMISTVRGIIIEKTANSALKTLYVPILNAQEVTQRVFG